MEYYLPKIRDSDSENNKDKGKDIIIKIIIENGIKNKNENINIKNIINDNEK